MSTSAIGNTCQYMFNWRNKMNSVKKRPNILCFITDQQRYDYLGCANNSILKTPNIDGIAKKGVLFNRAYVSNPLCMPARVTLFTGKTPRGHGVRTNGIPLSTDVPTMPEALRQAGYTTHSIGKLHLHNFSLPTGIDPEILNTEDFPESREFWDSRKIKKLPSPYYGIETTDFAGGHTSGVFGEYINWLKEEHPGMEKLLTEENPLEIPTGAPQCYKMSIPEELHYNRWISNRAVKFLEESKNEDKPFFLWCSFPDPHHPYAAPEPWCNMYNPQDIPVNEARKIGELDNLPPFYKKIYEEGAPVVSGQFGPAKICDEYLKEMIALTYGMISFVDNEIGKIMNKLKELKMQEDTIVVFLSDHGDMMGDHYMVRKGPFQFEGLLRIPFIWSWPGHFPEGIKSDGLASQIDFAPTILDLCGVEIPEGCVPLKPEAPMMPKPWPGKSLKEQLEGKVKSVNDSVIIENDEDYLGLRVRTFITDRYKITIYPGQAYGELFDLIEDPQEFNNLWNDSQYKNLKDKLKIIFLEKYILQDDALPRRLCHA